MKQHRTEPTDPTPQLWSPTRDDLSSRKGGILSINADHVLVNASIGYKLFFSEEQIAEIVGKNERQIEIEDIHHKHWLINLDHLKNIEFSAFMEDLAGAVAKFWVRPSIAPSARDALGAMALGDELCHQGERLATLIHIDPQAHQGPVLTFEDTQYRRHNVHLGTLDEGFTLNEYTHRFKDYVENAAATTAPEPRLMQYFQDEFVPKMLAQMANDHDRYGDTWLMPYTEGTEDHIRGRYDEYFGQFEESGKPVPWFKVAGYAIIAQARQDHPDWLM
ncbi:MAG: hypothetical protein K0B06_03445 [Brevefilum sp.]|nr:hypothetical protein [Brevefilum sp.]